MNITSDYSNSKKQEFKIRIDLYFFHYYSDQFIVKNKPL